MKAINPTADAASAVRPARAVAAAVSVLTALAIIALSLSGLGLEIKLLIALLTALYGTFHLRKLLQPPVNYIEWRDGELLLHDRHSGRVAGFHPQNGSFVSPAYTGLKLKSASGHQRSLGLFRGQVNPEFWRQSMIQLRALGPSKKSSVS